MKIEVLYFEGCPHILPTLDLLRQVAAELRLDVSIQEIEVDTSDPEHGHAFHGSPTVLVDGLDLDPSVGKAPGGRIGCRIYGSTGVPSRDMVAAALTRMGR